MCQLQREENKLVSEDICVNCGRELESNHIRKSDGVMWYCQGPPTAWQMGRVMHILDQISFYIKVDGGRYETRTG